MIIISLISGVATLLAFLYLIFAPQTAVQQLAPTNQAEPLTSSFRIKHIYHHGAGKYHKVHRRLDITDKFIHENGLQHKRFDSKLLPQQMMETSPWLTDYSLQINPDFTMRRMSQRDPDFVESYLAYVHKDTVNEAKVHLDWVDEREIVPNITDRNTVLNLALMAANAYVEEPGTGDWTDVGEPWVNRSSYGWMEDGIRGYIFSNDDDSIVVISIKGTSAAYVSRFGVTESIDDDVLVKKTEADIGHDDTLMKKRESDTVNNDKINDNLLFSCCCARVSYLWTTVCDCYKSSYTCDQKCLEKELSRDDRYYKAVLDLYRNVSSQYPKATIWVTGHSLGGSLSSLLGRTYGLPVVSFQAPGELMATKRLHLPTPPGLPLDQEHVWHFGNTGDPIFMGVCNGASSTCSLGGYAMESQCHSGKTCVYDTVSDFGWSVSIYNHRIHAVIDNVILQYNETAECKLPVSCQDCFNWNYVSDDTNDKYKHTTTQPVAPTSSECSTCTTSTSHVCRRYNWWGRCVEWEDDEDLQATQTKA